MIETAKKRIFYFDELRALAILFVILCHTTTIYRPYYYTLSKMAIPAFLNMIGWAGVPLFFMISGALILNREYELKDFMKRRFIRILCPFIFWITITLVLDYLLLGFSTKQLMMVFLGKHRYTWYIWTLMGIYLFLPVLNSFIREYQLKGAEYFLLVWFIYIILNTCGYYPFHGIEFVYFSKYIGYPVLGYYLVNKDFRLNDKSLVVLSGIAYVIFLLVNLYCQGHGIIDGAYLTIFTVLESLCLFLFFKSISDYCDGNLRSCFCKLHNKIENGKLGKIIFSISMCSYGMYFINSFLFEFIKTWHINTFKMLPVIFISVTLISWLIMVVLNRIPFMQKLIGTK